MSANRLIMLMSSIPQSVIDLNHMFNAGIFNKDRTKRQFDGYVVDENESVILPKTLCHSNDYLFHLCRGEDNPDEAVQLILSSSYELSSSEYRLAKLNINSEWYIDKEVSI